MPNNSVVTTITYSGGRINFFNSDSERLYSLGAAYSAGSTTGGNANIVITYGNRSGAICIGNAKHPRRPMIKNNKLINLVAQVRGTVVSATCPYLAAIKQSNGLYR